MQVSLTTISYRVGILRICHLAGMVVAMVGAMCGSGHAQGKLEAQYSASLAGIGIGKGTWTIEIGDDQYASSVTGATSGLLHFFTTSDGKGASRGTVHGDSLAPTLFVSTIHNDKKLEELKIVMNAGTVKDLTVVPPTTPHPDRVPLTDAHRHGIIDPVTAGLIHVPGTGDPVTADACRHTIPVFDGRMRFDLRLTFDRMETVHATKGYQGPTVVCKVQFVPVAGHLPERTAIKYLAAQREAEVWLAPIANTRILAPYRVSIPTPLGRGVVEATEFVTTALPHSAQATTAAANR